MTMNANPTDDSSVDLYWLPLGAGEAYPTVRWSGRLFEALVARRDSRRPQALFHSALEVRHEGVRFVIEMAPVWSTPAPADAIVREVLWGLHGSAGPGSSATRSIDGQTASSRTGLPAWVVRSA